MSAAPEMTARERWLAALHFRPLDRLPFWPKVFGGYLMHQDKPFRKGTQQAFFDYVGCDPQYQMGEFIVRGGTCTGLDITRTREGETHIYSTPYGDCTLRFHYDAASDTSHPVEFPVKGPEDLRRMTAWYRDSVLSADEAALAEQRALIRRVGDKGVAAYTVGESPLMYFLEYLAGIDNGHYLLCDYGDEVEELFDAIQADLEKRAALACERCSADLFYFAENTSTTLISPTQYGRYCLGHVRRYAEIIRGYDRNIVLHMCGHLKLLLDQLAETSAHAFEAFTTPPVGSATLAQGRAACPDKCLIGGTNAVLWMQEPEEIIAALEETLAGLPHHRGLVITSAGVMPPACRPETIRRVFRWLCAFPLRLG